MPTSRKHRCEKWNYNSIAYYFVTIITKNRTNDFGTIDYQFLFPEEPFYPMVLNDAGKIVYHCWMNIPNHYHECELDNFVIMPNHVHGILILNPVLKKSIVPIVDNRHACCLRLESELGLESKSRKNKRNIERIPSIVGSFKSVVSNKIHLMGNKNFAWQRSYYDRIIRNERELFRIRKYIQNNPMNWYKDKMRLAA